VEIPDPGFAGDDGAADPAVLAALADAAAGRGEEAAAIAAVQGTRLLVPVVAVAGEVELDEHGLAHDKTTDMATVLVQRPDGRTGLLAFTGLDSLRAWRADARPVPVSARTAAQAALQDGAAALLVDLAGPALLVIEGPDLRGLAQGWTLVRVGERTAWAAPAGGPAGHPAGE
jgi:hypothetical protein